MIVIEGMDNSGKTTLVNWIHELTGLRVIKSLGPVEDFNHAVNWALIMMNSPEEVILDRFNLISETVYGSILRKNNPFEKFDVKSIWEIFKSMGPLIIYCRPPDEKILSFKDGRAQMAGVIENSEKLLLAYDDLMDHLANSGFLICNYDFTNPDELTRARMILEKYLGRQLGRSRN